MKRIISLTVVATLAVYIPYLYFFKPAVHPGLDRAKTAVLDTVAGNSADPGAGSQPEVPEEVRRILELPNEGQVVEKLIELHRHAMPQVSKAAFDAIRSKNSIRARKYVSEVERSARSPSVFSKVRGSERTGFLSP